MGAEAIRFLFNQIEKENTEDNFQTKVLSPSLVIRGSTSR
jgi:DNA-binding LacI/PurR family transcriptional regulator